MRAHREIHKAGTIEFVAHVRTFAQDADPDDYSTTEAPRPFTTEGEARQWCEGVMRLFSSTAPDSYVCAVVDRVEWSPEELIEFEGETVRWTDDYYDRASDAAWNGDAIEWEDYH